MELTDKDIEKIEAYWQEQLSETERLAFENRLESDAVFRQEADKIHLITEGLNVLKKRQLRQRLKNLDATLPPIDPPNAMGWVKIVMVALALALAALGVWYFMIRVEKPKISGPIAAVFEPYPALGITMGDTQNERRKDVMVLYAQKEYAKAIPKLNDSFKETQDSMLLFYKGISHLALGQSTEAQMIFEQLQHTGTVPQEATQWYLTLSYVASKQYDKAIVLLKNNTSDKYKDKAQKLLEEVSQKE